MSRIELFAVLTFLPALTTGSAMAETLEGTVRLNGVPRAQVLVSVENLEAAAAHSVVARLDHAGGEFHPNVLPVVRGTRVEIGVSDGMPCRLFSASPPARFNLARRQGRPTSVLFAEPGVVKVQCEEHPSAHAWVVVKPNPYFALTAEDGSYRIAGVPEGVRILQVWYRDRVLARRQVSIEESLTVIDFDAPVETGRPAGDRSDSSVGPQERVRSQH